MTDQLELPLDAIATLGHANVCWYCGRPSTLLCDGIIACISNDGKTLATGDDIKTLENPFITCDRPLCQDCVAESQWISFQETSEDGRRTHSSDTRDICPQCFEEGRHITYHNSPFVTLERAKELQRLRLQKPKGVVIPLWRNRR